MKHLSLLALFILSLSAVAQRTFQFKEYLTPEITRNGAVMPNGFAAGLNNPQFSKVDLNLDGTEDLLVFDRDGNSVLPYLSVGSGANTHWEFAPAYIDSLPSDLQYIVRFVDYNCDGKKDIFYKVTNGIGVYKNVSTSSSLKFEWALGSDQFLWTNYSNGQSSQVYVLGDDIPVIADVDGDGDVDVLSFETNGVQIFFYQNTSANNCGLEFLLKRQCWGGFREDLTDNGVEIDACIPGNAPPFEPEGTVHAGSSILSLDMNADGLQELIAGDISFNEATYLPNTGTLDSAYMGSQVNNWAPDGVVPIELFVFPAFYYEDVTHDGIPDLLAAPNDMPGKTLNQVWLYTNNGAANNPNFTFTDSSFLQNTMIDMGEGAYPTFVDLNGDGLEDIIVGNRGVWQSDGTYRASVWYLENTSTPGNISFSVISENYIPLSGFNNPLSLYPSFGDLDGDGDFDLLLGLEDGTIAYYQNTGSSTSPNFVLSSASFQGIDVGWNAAPELYDFDGDGDLDLLIGEKVGKIHYYNNNNGSFNLVTTNFGGIDVDILGQLTGYAMPRMYDFGNKDQLMIGSEHLGLLQFDSASSIINQPSTFLGQFGTDNDTTKTSEETIFGALKRTGRNQLLFTASELLAMGFEYGQVEKLQFNVAADATSNSLTSGIRIRMANVDTTELNGWIDNLTEIHNASIPITPGWNEITLQDPFIWDGESSLVIEFCFSRNLPLMDNPMEATDVGFKANAYGDYTGWNSNASNGCTMPYMATSTLRPNTRIEIRPITPPAGEHLSGFRRMSVDFSDLDNDGYPEAIIGTYLGGMMLMKGEVLDSTIGIEVNPHLEATIYPNPTTGRIQVQLDNQDEATYYMYDLNGKQIMSGEFAGSIELNIGDRANGIYLLHIVQDRKSSYAKIIKQ